MRIAVSGGVYSNPWALRAFIDDARGRGAERLYCLGDLGGYGADPEAVGELLISAGVTCIAGNYDVAIAAGGGDCGCGYRDPRDQEYAQVMYNYTRAHTSAAFAAWMSGLPTEHREDIGGCDVHFVHGSTIGLNDFWWESLPEAEHERRVSASDADVIMCTHSGLPWVRKIADSLVVNVGVLGRPANDGTTAVRYAIADLDGGRATARIIRLDYAWQAQAAALRSARLPDEFASTCETGWWTTCLEILPATERSRGAFHVYDSSVPAILDAFGLDAAAWPDPDPALPVRPLWGSPMLPSRIWYHPSTPDLAELAGDAATSGIATRDVSAFATERDRAGQPMLLPELTVTGDGWFWHPGETSRAPLVPAEPGTTPARQLPTVRRAVARQLLIGLQRCGLLQPPRYCTA